MNEENSSVLGRLGGIDVSHHQTQIDWQKVKAGGYEFVFLKATEGGTYTDPDFARRRAECHAANLPVGFYHFFRPKGPIQAQIDNFVNVVGRLQPGELRPVCDLEVAGEWKGIEARAQWEGIILQDRIKMVVKWCEAVEAACGLPPLIYLSPSFANEILGNAPELARWSLWLANYAAVPTVPAPWTSWTFWQYSESGRIDGIPANDVDLNWFAGTREDLRQYQVPLLPEPPAPPPCKNETISPMQWLVNAGIVSLLFSGLCLWPGLDSVSAFAGACALAMTYCIFSSRT